VRKLEVKVRNIENVKPEPSDHLFLNLLSKKENNVLRDSFIFISPDNSSTETLVAGYTIVYPGCRTSGHDHIQYEEIYHIVKGKGIMTIDGREFEVKAGDTFLVPFGLYHTTSNPNAEPLEYFWVLSPNHKEIQKK